MPGKPGNILIRRTVPLLRNCKSRQLRELKSSPSQQWKCTLIPCLGKKFFLKQTEKNHRTQKIPRIFFPFFFIRQTTKQKILEACLGSFSISSLSLIWCEHKELLGCSALPSLSVLAISWQALYLSFVACSLLRTIHVKSDHHIKC